MTKRKTSLYIRREDNGDCTIKISKSKEDEDKKIPEVIRQLLIDASCGYCDFTKLNLDTNKQT